jgi:hypothetical protein
MGCLKWGVPAVLVFLLGCGGGNSGVTGTLKVSMTDASACGFDQVSVTVSKVRVHQSADAGENDAGWTDLNLTPGPKKIDLAALTNGILEGLGEAALPVGQYTQLRLVLVPNTPARPLNNSVTINGVETAIDTPSAVRSGIKLIHRFDVSENALVDLVLDFDACKSIVIRGGGGYLLKPVVTVVPQAVSGAIAGNVVSVSLSPVAFHPIVNAEQGGMVVKSTVPNPDGSFILSPLQQSSTAGDYAVVIAADNAATAIVTSVPVTARQTTTISDAAHPIVMAPSGAHAVGGAIAPADTEATIRAIQSISINPPCFFSTPPCLIPTILTPFEIRSTTAMGSYALILPIAAPWLGSYEAGTPIALTQQGSLAGKYELEASADGFSTQTVSVDLSGSDVTRDFTLTP